MIICHGKTKMNTDTYPDIWEEIIQNKDIKAEDKEKAYYVFCRSSSEKKCIIKYGEEKGKEKWAEIHRRHSHKNTLEGFIERYGREEGWLRYKDKNERCSGTLEQFIRRHGEIEGLKKWEIFKSKCSGASKKFYSYCDMESVTPSQIKFWTNKGYSYDDSVEMISNMQSSNSGSLVKFIEKYGEENGREKWVALCEGKSLCRDVFIEKYGAQKWEEKIAKMKHAHSMEYFIEKYGEEGKNKWQERNKNKAVTLEKCIEKYGLENGSLIYDGWLNARFGKVVLYSKVSIAFFDAIIEDLKLENVFYKDNEYKFFVANNAINKEIKMIMPDFYMKEIGLVVEFQGDYFHKNPEEYKDTEENKRIWERDKDRIEIMKTIGVKDVLIVWESDYRKEPQKTTDIIKNEILKRLEGVRND